ncbi:MAG TPA: hypothetical protein VHK63_08170 [Candidatus Limnocylindria bacterium]|nr:hypothetical protein [Candidatus Limnocylindria bacterium]
MAPDPGRGRGPADYRPDLRPLIALIVLLGLVVIGWWLLSPVILPVR